MAEHSPTPWQSNGPYLYGSGEVRYVRIGRAMPEPDIIGRTICEIGLWLDMPEEQEANGTFIVLAANCHEELVAALEPFGYDDPQGDCFSDDAPVEIRCEGYVLLTATAGDLRQAAAALAKAKEGTVDERPQGDIYYAADYERDLKHEDGREEDENWMQRIRDDEDRFLGR